ncbi:MAG: response regulator [Oligoflexia bacterium]|nr:response regulator [Oligoflexia bacterium]
MTINSINDIRANILLVDDRPENLFVLESVLKEAPEYKLFMANSGAEAIELVKITDFALILLDIQMPDMDGYETASNIKLLERGRDVPIVMVTAIFKEDPHVIKGYNAGAIDYVPKPFNPDILKAKVGIYANLYLKSRRLNIQNQFLIETQKILSLEKNVRTVLDNLPIGILVADSKGKIYQVNQEAKKIWCGSKLVEIDHYDEYTGWWFESGSPIKSHEWALARAIDIGQTSQNEIIKIQCFDGSKKIILNSACPILDSHGTVTGAVDVMQDVTGQKWIQEINIKF